MAINLLTQLAIYSPVFLTLGVFLASIFIGKINPSLFYLGWVFVVTGLRMLVQYALTPNNTNNNNNNNNNNNTNICDAQGLGWGQGGIYPIYVLSFSFFYFCVPMFITSVIQYPLLLTLIIYWVATSWLLFGLPFCHFTVQEYLGNVVSGAGLGTLIAFGMYASPMRDSLFFNSTQNGQQSKSKKQTFRCAVSPQGELLPKGGSIP